MSLKLLPLCIYIIHSYLHFASGQDLPSTTADILASNGYSVENHIVTTEDGYILEMFRIPSKSYSGIQNVYLLMHDTLGSSDDFIIGEFQNTFAYYFTSLGLEIWLLNARGNKYSMGHQTLNASIDRSYWNYSWHEIGVYDLPKTIDYVINVTGSEQVFYYGFGQGGTAALVLLSMLPQYNDKLEVVYLLGPIVFLGNVTSQYLRENAAKYTYNSTFLDKYSSSPFVLNEEILNDFGRLECRNTTNNSSICDNFYFIVSSYDSSQTYSYLDVSYISIHNITTCSTNQFFHYAQLVLSGRFAQYNYGSEINMAKYGSTSPPDYNLTNILTSIVSYSSQADITTSKIDIKLLQNSFNNEYSGIHSDCDNFSHIDFYNAHKYRNCFS